MLPFGQTDATTTVMRIKVLLFAAYREAVGASTAEIEVPEGTAAGDVWHWLVKGFPALQKLQPPSTVAVNDAVCAQGRVLTAGDKVALLAPVSGGAPFELVTEPIRVDEVLQSVRHAGAGAVVLFLGTVRDNSRGRAVDHLEYEAYESLAVKEMAGIAEQAAARWGARLAIVHRTGSLAIGEISVAVAASAPHRREAFEAGRFAVDTLKLTVPIWKKEIWQGGEEWIGGEEGGPATP